MTTIPDTFNKFGYVFNLVKRSPKVAIYEQTKGGRVYAYEVVRVKTRAAGEINGKPVPARECLPSTEEWGVRGRTYTASIVGAGRARIAAEAQFASWSVVVPKAA